MAFEEVCPERIDLIHKNYRKLCNLLIDVEEWGQVVIISMLTRYARTQFTSPWKEVRDGGVVIGSMLTQRPSLWCEMEGWRTSARQANVWFVSERRRVA